MDWRGGAILMAALAGGWNPSGACAEDPRWRQFTAADGLLSGACVNVTAAANDDVVIRFAESDAVAVFDGYEFVTLPGPAGERRRVHESPGGQLWTVTTNGLREFRAGEWPLIPVAQIARHFRAGGGEIPLLPIRQGRVLAVMPEGLLQVTQTGTNASQIESLAAAEALKIGPLTNLFAARNGSLVLVGRAGFARSRQPFRALQPETGWDITREPPPEIAERKPLEITPPGRGAVHDRVDLPGGVAWVAGADGLARFGPTLWSAIVYSNAVARPKWESAEWLPRETELLRSLQPVFAWSCAFKSRQGELWLGGASGIARVREETLQLFISTNQLGPEQVRGFAESSDGRLVCATPAKVWEFDGREWQALRVGLPEVTHLLFAANGTLWVATQNGVHRQVRGWWIHNDAADGLPTAPVMEIRERSGGEVIADTPVGWFRFDPNADLDPPRTILQPPPTPRVREGESLRVTFRGQDRWNLTPPGRLLFSHKLDEREWSAFQETTEVVLPELPAGRHLFLVRALDRNGNLERQPARLEFTVVLPWYRETRLVLVLAVALTVAVFFAGLAWNRHRRLQHSYADVERQVAERTRELALAQRELLHSQKMNALGTLAAGIAHDFNNILSIIKGSAQIIEDHPDDPAKIRTRVDRIKTVVQQGAGIVEAMLGFSRPSPDPTTPVDVNGVVADTVRLLGDRFLRGVEINFHPGADLPAIPVARDFVQQVLLNFILNAAEAMERRPQGQTPGNSHAGRPQITIHTRRTSNLPPGLFLKPAAAPGFIEIAVTDTGEGIAPGNLPRIFEPFFTTKAMSSQRGTGLGLSMVYELARKLEAGLAVESQLGVGSTFTLIIPAGAR
jgi:signal transduction histidine kinase